MSNDYGSNFEIYKDRGEAWEKGEDGWGKSDTFLSRGEIEKLKQGKAINIAINGGEYYQVISLKDEN